MATKNNLDVGGEMPHHTELSDNYKIGDGVYDLAQIVAAVKDAQSNDDWNARTMTDRLGAIKTYLKDMNAEKVTKAVPADMDVEKVVVPDEVDVKIEPGAVNYVGDAGADDYTDMFVKATAATGPVDTLRAFNQHVEADEVEALKAENEELKRRIEEGRQAQVPAVDTQQMNLALHGDVSKLKAPY